MDIQRKSTRSSSKRKYWFLAPIALLGVAAYFTNNFLGDASFFIARDELVTAKVEQGDFQVNVRSTGTLKPLTIRWVSSQVSGRVEQVLVKAGAQVQEGDILMQLSNPELHRELEKTQWELQANKAESHAALVALESQQVELENAVVAAEYSYQSAKLKLDAETALIKQGNATVSALDYQKSQLAVKQQHQSWVAQQQKAEKMRANIIATKSAHQARTGLVENNYQRVKEQVAALNVRATTSGIVQKVSLELGERAQVGDSVALVANQQQLFAELLVQEVRARDIALGQRVIVDTRTSEITGKVQRIDPAVNDGMVLVDVSLTSALPSEARPELTVDGLIEVSHIKNALYVKRPVFAPKYTDVGLYKLIKDQKFASKKLVKLGQSSVSKIQIISGLSVGDEIIISDTSHWQEHQEIMIN